MYIEKEKDKPPVIYDADNPIGFDTPNGVYYIVQREYGFEIIKDTKSIFKTGFVKHGEVNKKIYGKEHINYEGPQGLTYEVCGL